MLVCVKVSSSLTCVLKVSWKSLVLFGLAGVTVEVFTWALLASAVVPCAAMAALLTPHASVIAMLAPRPRSRGRREGVTDLRWWRLGMWSGQGALTRTQTLAVVTVIVAGATVRVLLQLAMKLS